jgi:hypothetical protein
MAAVAVDTTGLQRKSRNNCFNIAHDGYSPFGKKMNRSEQACGSCHFSSLHYSVPVQTRSVSSIYSWRSKQQTP